MFSLASSETTTSSTSSTLAGSRPSKSGPVLVAGKEPPGRRKIDNDAQFLRQTGFKVEDIDLIKTLFDFYDGDRDGKLSLDQACLLCTTLGFHPVEAPSVRCSEDGRVDFRQLVQTAGFVRANQTPTGGRGGSTKHFFRMANRMPPSSPIPSKQLHRFFQSIGVDVASPTVERISTAITKEGDESSLREDDLVEFVERVRRQQESLAHQGNKK